MDFQKTVFIKHLLSTLTIILIDGLFNKIYKLPENERQHT